MRTQLVALLGAVSVLAGCGGGNGSSVVRETVQNVRDIRSGVLHVKLLVQPHGTNAQPFGFELEGPFSLGRQGVPPLARLTYTQIANGTRERTSVVLGHKRGSITSSGARRELSPTQLRALRAAVRTAGAQVEQFLPVQDWVRHATLHACGAYDCVEGRLDVVEATNDLLALAGSLGRELPALNDAGEEQLSRSARTATFVLVTGKTDRLLHRLSIRLDFGVAAPHELARILNSVVGATVTLDVGVDRPNATG